MEYKLENKTLTIKLATRIDGNNSEQVANEIIEIMKNGEYNLITLDACNLEYISSAGLRVILKIKKMFDNMKVINVKREVYDIFEMTGFTQMLEIIKEFRHLDVTGCPIIGKGAKGTVYRYDNDIIVKVYNDPVLDLVTNERFLARLAFVLGVPTAISYDTVMVGDKYGSVFELVNANNLTYFIKQNPEEIEKYASIMANLFKTVHSTNANPKDLVSAKDFFFKKTNLILEDLDKPRQEKLNYLLSTIKEENYLNHGDFHSNNIMMQNGEAILIDMDTLSCGNIIFDFANTYTCHMGFGSVNREMSEEFLGIKYELSQKLYNLFIKDYFEGRSDIDLIKDKIALLSLTRMYYHFKRRKKQETDYQNELNNILERAINLIDKLDDLNIN
ncbi:MAG: phosphotransferase [Bacilli bacterium]|nr:phosphotransferase [Bacilli bacterium]